MLSEACGTPRLESSQGPLRVDRPLEPGTIGHRDVGRHDVSFHRRGVGDLDSVCGSQVAGHHAEDGDRLGHHVGLDVGVHADSEAVFGHDDLPLEPPLDDDVLPGRQLPLTISDGPSEVTPSGKSSALASGVRCNEL